LDYLTETVGAGTPGAMPVDAARDVLRASIEQQMQDAIRFHEEAAEAQSKPGEAQGNPLDFNRPAEPNHSAIRTTTGAGKSEATRAAAAASLSSAKLATRSPVGPYMPRKPIARNCSICAALARALV
jgi:bacterioferritin-associated ferredoxin